MVVLLGLRMGILIILSLFLCKDMEEKDRMKEEDLKQLFDLLDRDEDDYLEFSDILAFVFLIEIELSDEEKRIRSFHFYNRFG